jgi:asparagine synthase (glutamine-hydrolysing)
MISDVPVGAFLSGGLDSSAIVSLAREWAPARLQCFTMANSSEAMASEGFEDDLPYARQVAEDLDVDLHVVEASPNIAADFGHMVYQLDEPLADPACLNVLFLSRIAAQNGVKVLLSGTGADDIFAGYRRHRAILLERYWRWLPKRARTAFARSARRLPQTTAAARRLSRAFHYADVDGDERIASYFFWTDPTLLDRLCGPALRDASSTPISLPLITALQELPATVPPINRMLALDQRFFLADHNLNYLDKMSMAAGVEARVPFLDPELVALASRLPVVYKQRGRTGKWILRKAMQGLLPDTVISRPKTGFGAPVRRWLRNELQPWVDDLCSTQALQDRGLFDPAAVQQLIRDDRAGRIDASYTIFSIICIELWCRQFLPARVAKSQTLRLSS